jgi:hypothetical protein
LARGVNYAKKENKMNYKDLENNLHFLDSTEFEHLLPVGCVQITDNEADSIRLSKVVPPTYSELRAAEYPSLADQADMQYWDKVNGTNTWETSIAAVKAKYPK